MGRKPNQILKGNHSSVIYFLYSRQDKEGKHQLKLRLKIEGRKPIELPVVINRQKITVTKRHFNSGRVIGGFENESLNNVNLYLAKTANRLVKIGDEYFTSRKKLTPLLLSKELDKLGKVLPKKNTEIVTTISLDTNSDPDKYYNPDLILNYDITKTDIEHFEAAYPPNFKFESKEDAEEALVDISRSLKRAEIIKQPVEEIYTNHPEMWDSDNIFHCLGFVRYGTKIDAAGDKVPFIPFSYQKLFKKLIYYRINEKPSERMEDFNEEWVHNFYRFIIKGFERRLQKVEANPFVLDKTFKKSDNPKLETYNVNSFGEGIHKHMVGYIKQLFIEKLIHLDFSARIQAGAFTKEYGGNKSSYGEAIYFITPKEFLTLMNAEIKNETLDITRDLFISQVMIGALRVKNLTGEKILNEIDHFTLVSYTQAKTKSLISNVLLKPVKDILKKHNGKLPVVSDSDYNDNLKELFKHLKLSRTIQKKNKKLSGVTVEEIKLHDLISSKFARSSYYVIMGAMGVPIETIAKRAGHSSTDIAMKHYYNISNDYSQSDVVELLEKFKK